MTLKSDGGSDENKESWTLYCLCDGHNGEAAAYFVQRSLWRELAVKLPTELPMSWDTEEGKNCATQVRIAITEALSSLERAWRRRNMPSGCSITLALVGGWLLTVANVGDALAYLDSGAKIIEMTKSHRLQGNKSEQDRLERQGVIVAPMSMSMSGPAKHGEEGSGNLRVWPGGLSVSRSFGDVDVRREVVCVPHIRQVFIPPTGARLIVASSGLWDTLNPRKVSKLSQRSLLVETPDKILEILKRGGNFQLMDDVLIMAVDIKPHFLDDFSTTAKALKTNGLITMFSSEKLIQQQLPYFADMDSLQTSHRKTPRPPSETSVDTSQSFTSTHRSTPTPTKMYR